MDVGNFIFLMPSIPVIGFGIFVVSPLFIITWLMLLVLFVIKKPRLLSVFLYFIVSPFFFFVSHYSMKIIVVIGICIVLGIIGLFESKIRKTGKLHYYMSAFVILHGFTIYFLWLCILTSAGI